MKDTNGFVNLYSYMATHLGKHISEQLELDNMSEEEMVVIEENGVRFELKFSVKEIIEGEYDDYEITEINADK